MIDDAFKRERENIRAKMLKYSRAINEGKPTDDILAADDVTTEIATPKRGDDVLKKRLEKDKKTINSIFEGEKKEKFGFTKDLIDVKLEKKTSLTKRLFNAFTKKKSPPNSTKSSSKSSDKKRNVNSNTTLSKTNSNINSPKTNSTQNASNAQNQHSPNPSKRQILDIKINTQPTNSALKDENFAPKKHSKQDNTERLTKNLAPNSTLNSANSASRSPSERANPTSRSSNKTHKANSSSFSTTQAQQSPQIQPNDTKEDSIKVKNTLLQGHSHATQDEKNLGKNQLLFAALCIAFAVLVFVPKIYITSNIYYLSRDIASLRTQESVLSEENKELNKKLENMRFQNQILDYLE